MMIQLGLPSIEEAQVWVCVHTIIGLYDSFSREARSVSRVHIVTEFISFSQVSEVCCQCLYSGFDYVTILVIFFKIDLTTLACVTHNINQIDFFFPKKRKKICQ